MKNLGQIQQIVTMSEESDISYKFSAVQGEWAESTPLRRSCARINKRAINGTTAAAKGIAPAPSELSTTAPPIIPPTAFAILKAEMFAVAASSGAAFPYFMTRICIGGTLAKDATPKMKAAARNGHLNGATSPTTIRDATIAAGHRISERRRLASAVPPPSVLPMTRPKPTTTSTQVKSEALNPAIRAATGALEAAK